MLVQVLLLGRLGRADRETPRSPHTWLIPSQALGRARASLAPCTAGFADSVHAGPPVKVGAGVDAPTGLLWELLVFLSLIWRSFDRDGVGKVFWFMVRTSLLRKWPTGLLPPACQTCCIGLFRIQSFERIEACLRGGKRKYKKLLRRPHCVHVERT